MPDVGTSGVGKGIGTAWTVTGAPTITHPTPANTNLATQLKRTLYTSVAVTANQVLGPSLAAASDAEFWKGDAANLGGFYFSAIFSIEAWANNAGRIFVGLASIAAGNVAAADAVVGDVIGFWHDTTDGANVASLLVRDNTTTTKLALTGTAPTIAAGQAFQWEMWNHPNDSVVDVRLTSINSGAKLAWTSTGAGPRAAIFTVPQVHMSNGADVVGADFAIGVANVYVTSSA